LTYDGLNIQANQLAHHLQSINLGPENVVAVSLERGIDYLIAMFAIWKAGAAYLPLDVAMPHDRMMFMASEANACCLITTRDVAQKKALQHLLMPTIFLDDPDFLHHLRRNPPTNPERRANRDNLAYIFYTSGTSGKPKGVCITHGSIVNMADDTRQSQEITASDRVLLFSPFCFDASIRDIHGALLLGASLYVPDEDEIFPGNLVNTLRQHSITYAVITPSVLRACKPHDLPDLSTIVVAGEAVNRHLIREWGTGRVLINAYGPTEATVCSTKRIYHDVTIGTPILNTQVHILDDDSNPVPVGSVGEIYVHGLGVSQRGYLNLPEFNAKCFRDDFFSAPGRTYKTGDTGRMLLGGEIEFLGRKEKKAQIKLHGQRIETEEIENVLRMHSAVHDAVVALRGAESHKILAAYVVPAVPSHLRVGLVDRLEALLREHLPSYSVPSSICLVDAFPVRATKKID
ncbi:amino acid adenylation, partial [Canariomyces notabilis]